MLLYSIYYSPHDSLNVESRDTWVESAQKSAGRI